MLFRHKNLGKVEVIIHSKNWTAHRLKPGDEVIIDKVSEIDMVKMIEQISGPPRVEVKPDPEPTKGYPDGEPNRRWKELEIYDYIKDNGIDIDYDPENQTKRWVLEQLKELKGEDKE